MRAVALDTKEKVDLARVLLASVANYVASRPAIARGAAVAGAHTTTAGTLDKGLAFLLLNAAGASLLNHALMEHALVRRWPAGSMPIEVEWMHGALQVAIREENGLDGGAVH